MAYAHIICWTCFIYALVGTAHGSRILCVLTPKGLSHQLALSRIANEAGSRGHDVLFLVERSLEKRLRTSHPYLVYGPASHGHDEEYRMPPGMSHPVAIEHIAPVIDSSCRALLDNATIMSTIRGFKPDLLLSENLVNCNAIIASKLNVSNVNMWILGPTEPGMTSLWPQAFRRMHVPNPLSYFPQCTMRATSQLMSFPQRLENVLRFWSFHMLHDYPTWYRREIQLHKDYGYDPMALEERRRTVLSIIPQHWAVEWPRPVPPDYKMVGPILARPGKPLPAELEAFMTSSGDAGVLLVSMGTLVELGLKQRIAMAAVFKKLPLKVLWRLTSKEVPDEAAQAQLGLGNNTKVMLWLPQNDILAHPKARAFVSHVGANSVYEAVYHGKPIIALPCFGDQYHNADKVVGKGFGLRVDVSQIGTPAFEAAIVQVLNNPWYTEAARAASVRLRAQKRTPVQEAADWIDHVLETGGEAYMRTPADELNVFVLHSLDTYGFLAGCAGVLLYLAWRLATAAAMSCGAVLAHKAKLA